MPSSRKKRSNGTARAHSLEQQPDSRESGQAQGLDVRRSNRRRSITTDRASNLSSPEPIEEDAYRVAKSQVTSVKRKIVTMQIERKVKLVTEQKTIPKESPVPEFPMKEWNVKIYILDKDGNEHPANCFTKVVYNLHPSFENPNQTFTEPPFTCTNEGWGEFEMSIDMYTTEKGGKNTVFHDLNFGAPSYDNIQTIHIKNPSQSLINILKETGPVATDEDNRAAKIRKNTDGKKKKGGSFDYEKMADALTNLNEDDLLHVIQLIHDNKSEDTYTKNDIDRGEFSVDLYTMPEGLARMIWDFLAENKLVS